MASKIVINLDTSKENYILAKCKQNDDLTLEASIFENGLEKDLTNAAITIQALKADKTYIIQNTNITKENNKIIADLDRDFTRAAGKTEIEILLVESSKQNTTFSFCLEVVGSVIRGAVESSNTVTILEELDNKIVEAGQVRDETEQLIQSGGAATTGDIQEINSQLADIAIICERATGILEVDTLNLQNAINKAIGVRSKIKLSGNYYIDGNILSINSNMFIEGNQATLTIKGSLDLTGATVRFNNVIFTSKKNDNDESKPLIKMYNTHMAKFENCSFELSYKTNRTLIYGARSYYALFDNCSFSCGYERNINNCKTYDGIGLDLVLFNSSKFVKCKFNHLSYGAKILNSENISFDNCAFEHIKTKSVFVSGDSNYSDTDTILNTHGYSENITINDCYFETVWDWKNEVRDINSVATEWVDGCCYVEFDKNTYNCKMEDCYCERLPFSNTNVRLLKHKAIINNGVNNDIIRIGDIADDVITNAGQVTLINSNPELLIKDDNGIPLGCSLDDNVEIMNIDGYNFSFKTSKANTGLHYIFYPFKSVENSCFLIKLKSSAGVKIRRMRSDGIGIVARDFFTVDQEYEISFDSRIMGTSGRMTKDNLYYIEILNADDGVENTISVQYIKVLDKGKPYAANFVVPDISNSAFCITDNLKINNSKYPNDKSKDILTMDFLGNMFSSVFNTTYKASYIKDIFGSSMFINHSPSVTFNYDNVTKETSLTLDSYLDGGNQAGCKHNIYIPNGIFDNAKTVDVLLYLEAKVINPVNTFGGRITFYSHSEDGSVLVRNIKDFTNTFYAPLTFKLTIDSTANYISLGIFCNIVETGDIGTVKYKNLKVKFIGNPNFNAKTSEIPNTGVHHIGDKYLISNPIAGGYSGYVCTTSGNPGVWKKYGSIES